MAGAKMTVTGDYRSGNIRQATRDLSMIEKQGKAFSSSLTSSFTGMGAALGGAIGGAIAFQSLITFLQDSAQAAMEDEKSMVALATAMDNVGLSAKNAEAEGLINSMSLQSGIADDRLRPAYQKLVTATKDVAEAQGLLQTAMDLSAAGYGDLESASRALSSAAMGNFTALQRLKVPIDANIIKSRDFDAAMQSLNKTVGGQAAAAAETYQGKMDRLTVSANEAKEAIGYALLNALDDVSEAFGGVGGAQGAIQGFGQATANFVTGVGVAVTAMARLTAEMVDGKEAGTNWGDVVRNIGLAAGVTFPPFMLLVGAIEQITDFGDRYSRSQADAAKATRGLTSATVAAGIAMGDARPAVNDLTEEVQKSGLAAYESAQSFQAFWTAAANLSNQQAITRQLLNTSGTVGSVLFAEALRDLRTAADDTGRSVRDLGTSTGGAGKAAEDMAIKWKAAAASIGSDVEILKISMGGGGEVIASGMVSAFQNRLDAFKSIVATQTGIIQQAREALNSYAQSVTDTIMGKINFSTSATDAEGNSVPLTPEQIVTMILGDIANQSSAVTAIAGIATKIPPALTQQIMALPPDAAIALANYLAANPAMVEQLNTAYAALAELTKTSLGVPMGVAFAEVGGKSAASMITSAKEKIAAAAESFSSWVKSKLDTSITVSVNYVYNVGTPPGIPGRATGGPVSAGSPYVVGEKGPELFIPDSSGTIIPNGVMSGGDPIDFGNTYNINVTAGVGDPRQIGEQVVSYIKRFEAASGPVFARA